MLQCAENKINIPNKKEKEDFQDINHTKLYLINHRRISQFMIKECVISKSRWQKDSRHLKSNTGGNG